MKDIHNYDDIINLPYTKSKRHKPMTLEQRAAQFAPFAALRGHHDSVEESSRLTDQKKILDENRLTILNQQLNQLNELIKDEPFIKVTYFIEDLYKEGGSYVIKEGTLKKIDEYLHLLIMSDGTKINISDIYEIEDFL